MEDKAGVKNQVEWCAVTEMDQKQNSLECLLFSAAALLLPALSTPPSSKSSFSTYIPSQAQRRVIRIAKKRKRSIGDLSRRRQRLMSFQLEHTPTSTPHKLEPEISTLESRCGVDSHQELTETCVDLMKRLVTVRLLEYTVALWCVQVLHCQLWSSSQAWPSLPMPACIGAELLLAPGERAHHHYCEKSGCIHSGIGGASVSPAMLTAGRRMGRDQ